MQDAIVVQLVADDVQQVVIEDTCIGPLDNEGLVGLILDLGEFPAEVVRQLWALYFHIQFRIARRHLIEHGLPNQAQHLVLGIFPMLLHLVHSRLQRVGRDLCHHLCSLQLCLQQMSVGLLFRGLLHNLLKHLILRLGQIFLFCLLYLIPE